ncbi:RECEPTOR-LIKE SERINE/THREONINE-PROTEIN KINASE SD1-8 [Salix viminalis]|uniref:RECEPTOR-LIKE SERINE/THREONINE-PROTEIN KINASE SD1-8 n=1 Tax=Salix viminalis TaxID=40686 RepID=A0A9Q0UWP7_SALVM|nr:RECEPTOR-LIKE SERINE/THREONINE-PROTEIN KINASE SD1-8 [Salix viminalis]
MIGVDGQVQQLGWLEGPWTWILFWSQPKDQAGVYGLCGVFGVFHENSSSYCECLKGFKPLVQDDWSSGCVRKSPLQCQNMSSVGKEDGFLKMSNLKLPANSKTYQKVSAGRCRLDCIENCSCMAYAYNNNNGCSLWEGDLINLQQSGVADGRAGAEIYIRLAASEPELQIGGNVKWKLRTALAVAIPTTLITLGLFMKEYTGHDIMLFDFDTNPGPTNNESSSVDNRKKRWSKNMELPLFSYESAWKLWSCNKASDLMDPTLGDPPSTSMLLRYINIGLLCVQESPADRPTMSDVISMIVNQHVALPEPKQPAFVAGRNVAEQGSLMSSAGVPSVNNVTITAIDAR